MSTLSPARTAAPPSPTAPATEPGRRAAAVAVWAAAALVCAVTAWVWVAGGALDPAWPIGIRTVAAAGSFAGIVAALAAMGGLVAAARAGALERTFGLDALWRVHRWLGIVTALALAVHVVADTLAWVGGRDLIAGLLDLLAQPWMVAAVAAAALVVVVAGSSWRRLRDRVDYETWYFLHTLGYLAVVLGFGHQLALGSSFAGAGFAWWWWAALMVATLAVVGWSRIGDTVVAAGRGTRVSAVTVVAPGIVAVEISGAGVRAMRAAGGQFVMLRVLAPGLWWQSHPYSLSSSPAGDTLRVTVKSLGDASAALAQVPVGTRVLAEGPYGRFTAQAAAGRPVLAVAGGIGVTPVRALVEDLPAGSDPVVVVRARHRDDVAHLDELEELVRARGGRVYVLEGTRAQVPLAALSAPALLAAIPDLASRAVFVCGPGALGKAVVTAARRAGVSAGHIHHESFGGN